MIMKKTLIVLMLMFSFLFTPTLLLAECYQLTADMDVSWNTYWYQLYLWNHVEAEGIATFNNNDVSENSSFSWTQNPIGALATPGSGDEYSACWWDDGTKALTVIAIYNYGGIPYVAGTTCSYTF